MNALFISKRYLFSRKSRNAINIITLITATGFMVCTAAMIIILSALNGFVSLVILLYSTFDADIKIIPKQGKVIHTETAAIKEIQGLKGIAFFNPILEENVLLKYQEKQTIATIKAVSNDFVEATNLDTMVRDGVMMLGDSFPYCTMGSGLAAKLNINLNDEFATMEVFVPKREQFDPLNPESSFNSKKIIPTGIFSVQQEIDEKYVLVPLKFAREILEYTDEASAIEILVAPGTNQQELITKIKQLAGANYLVQSRAEQHVSLYKLMKIEKWVAFLILAFILLIVSFNLIGSLLMIVIEKKKDFSILHAIGMSKNKIKNIIIGEGLLISCLGSIVGISLGVALCLGQKTYGFIRLGGEGGTFVVDAYPIEVQLFDVGVTFAVAIIIGLLASLYPAKTSLKIEPINS